MKRRTFIQTVAAVFGTAAIAPRWPAGMPTMSAEEMRLSRVDSGLTIDEVFAKAAHENIQRRTYAVMKGLA